MFEKFDVLENEEIKNHTTFKIGGPAKYLIFPKNAEELKQILEICNQNNLKYFILGNGSNILASDEGFDGVIINLKHFNIIKKRKYKDKFYVFVGAGVSLFRLNQYLSENGLSGYEWSYGIPGSVGGAIKMNAGAFDNCFLENVTQIVVLNGSRIKKIKNPKFSYRKSPFDNEIILSATLTLTKTNKLAVNIKMQNYFNQKKSSQPYDLPSAGSIFKRKDGLYPSKLIDEFGLKGLRINDAMISTKHAGFIVNLKNAKCADVLKLIEIVEMFFKSKNISFEKEIIYLH